MAAFVFEDSKLDECLRQWAENQQLKNPELVQKHIDYMKGSIIAFLYSDEAQPLRMRQFDNQDTGGSQDAPEQSGHTGLSEDQEPHD